jgi:hypothetical protein
MEAHLQGLQGKPMCSNLVCKTARYRGTTTLRSFWYRPGPCIGMEHIVTHQLFLAEGLQRNIGVFCKLIRISHSYNLEDYTWIMLPKCLFNPLFQIWCGKAMFLLLGTNQPSRNKRGIKDIFSNLLLINFKIFT